MMTYFSLYLAKHHNIEETIVKHHSIWKIVVDSENLSKKLINHFYINSNISLNRKKAKSGA